MSIPFHNAGGNHRDLYKWFIVFFGPSVRLQLNLCFTLIVQACLFCSLPVPTYLLLKYQLKLNALTSSAKGVGTSAEPARATGWRRYTAAQTV